MTYSLNINFKGDRKYLHATDFYQKINEIIKNIYQEEKYFLYLFVIKKFAKNHCELTLQRPLDQKKIVAICKFKEGLNNKILNGWVIETDLNVKKNNEFNEAKIAERCKINEDSSEIELRFDRDSNIIEDIIILGKIMSYKKNPIKDKKWFFGKIKVSREIFTDYDCVKLKFTNSLANKYIIFDIYIDNNHLGEVHYIASNS